MELNPFNWTAGPFLTLYMAIALVIFFEGFRLRLMIGKASQSIRKLSELELAYLAGGARRVADAALLCLNANKGATIDAKGRNINVINLTPLAMLTSRPLELSFSSDMTRAEFQKAIDPLAMRIRNRLQALGYCPTDVQMTSFRTSILPFIGALIIFGIIKVIVGTGRDHPVGFLSFLLVATAFAAVFLTRVPIRTRAGNDALETYRQKHARAARAPQDHELLLAVALTGPVVLSGTAYAAVHTAGQTMSGSGGDGGGGGCGGGGGGGCGGCS
jgi:uncharacterized protein (TIGR04222 family)